MPIFNAEFTYFPTLVSAPVKIKFENLAVLGTAEENEFTTAVDNFGNLTTVTGNFSDYVIGKIDKVEWNFGDGTLSSDFNPEKSYDFAGEYLVYFAAYSDLLYDISTGKFFRFKTFTTKTLKIGSMTYAWFKQHMITPQKEALETSQGWNDLISSSSKMFDRMYKEIKNVANAIDITKVDARFLEFFSDTFNHSKFYAKKVGYAQQEDNDNKKLFFDYDIFERIKQGIAGQEEINFFRRFIMDTASLFKEKGSIESLEDFFRLYEFSIKVKEMWTTNFGATPPKPIENNFILDPTLEKTNSKFKFNGISVTGYENDKLQVQNLFNVLELDNYHFVSKHSYPGDGTLNANCTTSFDTYDFYPNILSVVRDDGRELDVIDTCSDFDIVTECTSAIPDDTDGECVEGNIIFRKNDNWTVGHRVTSGITYKFWQAPTGYVDSLIATVGTLPHNEDEIAENSVTGGDRTDDYIWADWKFGVTVPPTITGITQSSLVRPSWETKLSTINFQTIPENSNLIQTANAKIETKNDFFVNARGFVEIKVAAYYVFTMDVGSTGSGSSSQHVGLFSLKHSVVYTKEELNFIDSLDSFTFKRDNTDTVYTIGTTATGLQNLYGKVGEYGIIEIRQNEIQQSSGYYYLEPGFYAFEAKSTYSSSIDKKLKVFIEGYLPRISNNTLFLDNFEFRHALTFDQVFTLKNNLENTKIEDSLGKGEMILPNSLLIGGDKFSVSYTKSFSTNKHYSGILSSTDPYKDLIIETRFSPKGITEVESRLQTAPQNTIMVVFRAINRSLDLYANVDSYYGVLLNGNAGEISLVQVEYNKESDEPIFRYLNLSQEKTDLDRKQLTANILDENNHILKFSPESFYDVKIKVQDNKVSVWFRDNKSFAAAVNNIERSISQNILDYEDADPFIQIMSNIDLVQSDANTELMDSTGKNIDVAHPYEVIDEAGQYGIAIRSSIFDIVHIRIIPLDKIDNNLLESQDKWKQIKPKFFDSKDFKLLQYNSYGTNSLDKSSNKTFGIQVANSYVKDGQAYELPTQIGSIDNNVVNRVYLNNVNAESFGSRLNVYVDKEFLTSRFSSPEDALNGIVVPFGSFYEPYINWAEVDSSSASYENLAHAFYMPFISESANILPHTASISAGVVSYPSQFTRTINSNVIEMTGYISDILNATSGNKINGLWEEVCPLSTKEFWDVPTETKITTIPNKVFDLIYRNKNEKTEILGVKILNNDILEKLICRYCENAIMWGLYEFEFPEYSIDKNDWLDSSSKQTKIKYFIPIGKLNKDNLFGLPAPEILRNSLVKISLLGVYAHHSLEGFTPNASFTQITIDSPNFWEKEFVSKIQSQYFLDINISLVDKFTKFNIQLPKTDKNACTPAFINNVGKIEECSIPNTFYLPEKITEIIKYLERKIDDVTYTIDDFEADYTWWTPKKLFTKRKFNVAYPENNDQTIFSGLNTPNNFYTNTDIITGSQGTIISLDDNYSADLGKYIVDVDWCVSSVGWDAEFATKDNSYSVGVFDASAYALIGFGSTSKLEFGIEQIVPVSVNMNAPIPLETVVINNKTSLTFGSYLQSESGIGKTFSPVGVYNWFFDHANAVDLNNSEETPRAGWDITELNDHFVECVKMKAVYGEIDPSFYEINKYFAFDTDKLPPTGSAVKINLEIVSCDKENSENDVLPFKDQSVLGTSDGQNTFFGVPPLVQNYVKWVKYVRNVFVDNFTLDTDWYYIRFNDIKLKSELVLNNQIFDFTKFIGDTKIIVDIFYDKLFVTNQQNKLIDNYFNKREINWITLLDLNDKYSVAKRLPDTEMKYTSQSLPYSIVTYKGSNVFKLVNKFDYDNPEKFSGEVNKQSVVGIGENRGSINVMQLTDVESTNFTISADVIFDKSIIDTDYKKAFELILKGENNFVNASKDWGISDFYYVGIGTGDWDISLGMRSIDPKTGEMKETFLASWGDFNIRNIKADTWYTIKATVSNTEIKIFFAEKDQPDKLIINYNINKKFEKFTERYLKGEFESLQAVIIGLQELGITYPDKLGDSVSPQYTFDNFKAEFAGTLPINGYYSGFRVFNPLTYVTNIGYTTNVPTAYRYASAFDVSNYGSIIEEIRIAFNLPEDPTVKKLEFGLNFTLYIQINDKLYYKVENSEVQQYSRDIETFWVIDDKIFIVDKLPTTDSGVGLNRWGPGEHTIVWSLSDNTQNISLSDDFFTVIPNLSLVSINRNGVDYNCYSVSASGISGCSITVESGDTITFTIDGDRYINWPLDGTLSRYNIFVRSFQEGFIKEYPVLVKDSTLYADNLNAYMDFTSKKIKTVHVEDNRLHVIFEDL